DRRVEKDSPAVGHQAHPEIDVFDARLGEASLVEAAGREKHVAPESSEAAPEGAGAPLCPLMHVMVEQVPETRDQRFAFRLVVVGAEHADKIRIVSKDLTDPREDVGVDLDVRVDEHENLSL